MIQCPLADEHNCDQSFSHQSTAQKHANVEHKNIRYPCPLAKENDCESVFRSRGAAKEHASSAHEKVRIPCPFANEDDCRVTFTSRGSVLQHVNAIHRKLRYPCPQTDEHDCPKTFSTKHDAKIHSLSHSGIKFVCPVAEEYGCDSVFSFQAAARNHAKLHTHRFICPRTGCYKRFSILQRRSATCRGSRPSSCRTLSMSCSDLPERHNWQATHPRSSQEAWGVHISLGHIESADFIPQPARELPLHSDFPLYSLILQHEGLDLSGGIRHNESSLGIRGTDSDSDVSETDIEDISNASDSDGEMQEELFPVQEELNELESGILTREHRLRILQQNTLGYVTSSPRSPRDGHLIKYRWNRFQ